MASTANNPTVPGVYVLEIPKFPPSVAAVSTAIPAFIGYTEKAQRFIADDLYLKPTRITSLLDYETYFGGPQAETGLTIIVEQTGEVDPEDATNFLVSKEIVSVELPAAAASNHNMFYSLQLYFANGGGPCYIVSVGATGAGYLGLGTDPDTAHLSAGLLALESEDEPTIILFPEGQNLASADALRGLQEAALAQCSKLQDRFAVMDVYPNVVPADAISTFRQITGDLKYGAAYFPNLVTLFPYSIDQTAVTITHNQNGATATVGSIDGQAFSAIEATNGAIYSKVKGAINEYGVSLAPGAAMAGVYARVDNARGVWKAPANVGVAGIKGGDRGLSFKVTDDFQDGMNVDPTAGKSVNAIRYFTGKGTLVWGARTLAGNDNEWRYVSVRRFFNMAEESIKKATYQFVFEPNDANTWVKVRAMIENFLILQWRAGALAGAKPEHAFYVRVGLGETMTSQDILEGKMNVEIGMAVVRPAEFIILKFSHKMQES